MKKLMLLVFSVGLFLMGSQARADWARQNEYAIETTTIAFSSAAKLCNAGLTWYFGVDFSTPTSETQVVDYLAVYDSSKTYTTTTVLGYCDGMKKLQDYNVTVASLTVANISPPGGKMRDKPIKLNHGLVVAPSVHTYNFITVYWAKPTE